MAKLTSAARNALPSSDFVFPGARKYPIENRAHAANAKARVAHSGTPAQKAAVNAAVARKFPGMGKGGKPDMKGRMAFVRSHKNAPAGAPNSTPHPANRRIMAQTGMKKMPY